MSNKNYKVLCGDDCLTDGMSKEQILTAIEQAVSTGKIKDVDAGFITKIKELNASTPLTFWVGSRTQYNALTEKIANCLYIITDDTSEGDTAAFLEELNERMIELENGFNALPRNQILYENKDGYIASAGEDNPLINSELINSITKYDRIAIDISFNSFNISSGVWTTVYQTIILQRKDGSEGGTFYRRFYGSFVRDIYSYPKGVYTTGTMIVALKFESKAVEKLSFTLGFANGVEYGNDIDAGKSEGDIKILRITGLAG